MSSMAARSGVIRNGQVVLDGPVDWPEGTTIAILPLSDEAKTNIHERTRRSASLQRAWAQAQAGQGISAEEFLKKFQSL